MRIFKTWGKRYKKQSQKLPVMMVGCDQGGEKRVLLFRDCVCVCEGEMYVWWGIRNEFFWVNG